MRLRFAIAVLIAALFGAPALAQNALSAQNDERILVFSDRVDVSDTGALLVTERISFRVTNEQIIHGVYRDIPTGHTDPGGNWNAVSIRVDHINRDGSPERYVMRQAASMYDLKIGKAEIVLEKGTHTYEIAYHANASVYVGDGAGAVYWNATGNNWAFAIDHATATVNLPQDAQVISTDLYTGSSGSTAQDGMSAPNPHSATFQTRSSLQPGEGLRVLVCFTFKGAADRWTEAVRDEAMVQRLCASRVATISWRTFA